MLKPVIVQLQVSRCSNSQTKTKFEKAECAQWSYKLNS